MSHITSNITRHTSYVIRHTSHVTRHLNEIKRVAALVNVCDDARAQDAAPEVHIPAAASHLIRKIGMNVRGGAHTRRHPPPLLLPRAQQQRALCLRGGGAGVRKAVCYVLRVASVTCYYVLRVTCYVLRVTCYASAACLTLYCSSCPQRQHLHLQA